MAGGKSLVRDLTHWVFREVDGQQVDNWEDHAQDRPQQGQKTAKPPQQPTRHLSFPANYARDQV